MNGLNKVMLIGRIGKDPNIFTFENGNKKMSFSLATNESYKDRNTNEWVEQTEWHNIVGYGYLSDKKLVKGDMVYVEGKIKTRKWRDNDGNDRYTTEIVAEKINILYKYSSDNTPAVQSSENTSRNNEAGNTPTQDALPGNSSGSDLPF
jgi:single-strand DNA-binding protein